MEGDIKMKKYLKVLLVFAMVTILATSAVSAGFWDITGFSIFDKIRDRMGGGQTAPAIGEPALAIDCEDTLAMCKTVRNGCRMDLDDCEMDLSGSEENLELCEGNLEACELEECEEIVCEQCEDCEDCRRTYCIGDWAMDIAYVESYRDFTVLNPNRTGYDDEVEVEYFDVVANDTIQLNFEIDRDLDISDIVAGETAADAIHITSPVNEAFSLSQFNYDTNAGLGYVDTDEIWVWYNDGDATQFGADPGEINVNVFFKDNTNHIAWFGSTTVDQMLFTWVFNGQHIGHTYFEEFDANSISLAYGYYAYDLEMHWGIDNGDVSFLGQTENVAEACELEFNP